MTAHNAAGTARRPRHLTAVVVGATPPQSSAATEHCGAASVGSTAHRVERDVDRHGPDHVHLPMDAMRRDRRRRASRSAARRRARTRSRRRTPVTRFASSNRDERRRLGSGDLRGDGGRRRGCPRRHRRPGRHRHGAGRAKRCRPPRARGSARHRSRTRTPGCAATRAGTTAPRSRARLDRRTS